MHMKVPLLVVQVGQAGVGAVGHPHNVAAVSTDCLRPMLMALGSERVSPTDGTHFKLLAKQIVFA